MRRARTAALLAAVLAAGSALLGCSSDINSGTDDGFISGNGTITQLPVGEREKPDEVGGETLEGEKVSLSDYAGKVVVINVWGSWCGPCRAEIDDLVLAAGRLAAQDVVFLGINTRDPDQDQGLAFQRTYDVPYASIFDPGGRSLLAFNGRLTPNAIPSTIIIDAEGRIAASIIGSVTSVSTLVGLVEDVLG